MSTHFKSAAELVVAVMSPDHIAVGEPGRKAWADVSADGQLCIITESPFQQVVFSRPSAETLRDYLVRKLGAGGHYA